MKIFEEQDNILVWTQEKDDLIAQKEQFDRERRWRYNSAKDKYNLKREKIEKKKIIEKIEKKIIEINNRDRDNSNNNNNSDNSNNNKENNANI